VINFNFPDFPCKDSLCEQIGDSLYNGDSVLVQNSRNGGEIPKRKSQKSNNNQVPNRKFQTGGNANRVWNFDIGIFLLFVF